MRSLKNTLTLIRASWAVLKADKEILFFPLLASVSSLVILLASAGGFYLHFEQIKVFASRQSKDDIQWLLYGLVFVFYFVLYFIMTYFNAAIVSCAVTRLRGGDPTFAGGIATANKHFVAIAVWSFLSATVGVVTSVVRGNDKDGGGAVAASAAAWLIDVSWALASFFVVPVMIVQGKGAVGALRESAQLLKKTWGNQIAANVSFGTITFLIVLASVIPAVIYAILVPDRMYWILPGALLAVEFFILSMIVSSLEMIFQSALYLYAAEGVVPEGFDTELLANAVVAK